MTDLGTLESPQTAPLSTVLDAPKNNEPSGSGAPKLTPDSEAQKFEPKSAADTLREVFKEEKGKDEAPADTEDEAEEVKEEKKPAKPSKEAKEDVGGDEEDQGEEGEEDADEDKPAKQRAKDGKFAPREPKEDRGDPADDAPKSFLPDAKEKWANVPNTVKRDINKLIADHEGSVGQYKEVAERYDAIRDFDELARQNGRDLRDSLIRVNQIENELQSNPIAGLNRVLMEAGPRKADGQPVSLFELAQFIVSKGQQGYQQMVAQPQRQQGQQQANPEVEQLKTQIAQMQQQQVVASVIDPFKATHPRYDELEDDIALFLRSGKIDKGYSPAERLEAAYDMAVRINPTSRVEKEAEDETEGRVADSFAGSKSIKSAPGAVSAKMELERGGSIRDVLEQERKKLRRS